MSKNVLSSKFLAELGGQLGASATVHAGAGGLTVCADVGLSAVRGFTFDVAVGLQAGLGGYADASLYAGITDECYSSNGWGFTDSWFGMAGAGFLGKIGSVSYCRSTTADDNGEVDWSFNVSPSLSGASIGTVIAGGRTIGGQYSWNPFIQCY